MPYAAGEIVLGKYRIEAMLGQGVFGEVYRVTDLALRVSRALKVLRKDYLTTEEFGLAQARFILEAQLGAQLNSPNPHPRLLTIYELSINEEQSILVMEYAAGGSLAEGIKKSVESQTPLKVEYTLQVGMEAAEGLSALHEKQCVHRDLKPANILFDSQGHARVADLGLVQTLDDGSDRSKLGSSAQPHPGTPAYKSPEQEQLGNLLRPNSDIYSLGVVLFEMLTWRKYTMLKPGTRVKSLRADVPKSLDGLLARMLSENPKDRPWDGAEAAQLLRVVQQEEKTRVTNLIGIDEPVNPEPGHSASELIIEKHTIRDLTNLTIELAPGVQMEFVRVPAGEFTMGSDKVDREKPIHKVTLPEYLIGKFPVTNRQYLAFLQAEQYKIPEHWKKGKNSTE